jgi:hypothetical protein
MFPLQRVENVIAGAESSGLGHGTREMPVWGPLFSEITSDRDYGKVRLHNVAKYLQLRSILPHLAMCLRTEDRSDFLTVLRVDVRLGGRAVLAVERCRL